MMRVDLSAVITGHAEGRLCVASLRSFHAAIEYAQQSGLTVEPLYVLDRPDARTKSIFFKWQEKSGASVLETDYGDQGLARNDAVRTSRGRFVAFLDGDDLWSFSWLVQAYQFLQKQDASNVVAHPEFNYFFEGQATVFKHIDQQADEFDLDLLRLTNYWDALAFCERDILLRYPYDSRDIKNGWAFEDWHWNAATLQDGIIHRAVPETLIFKRRRVQSQTVAASTTKARHRRTGLSRYSNPMYRQYEESK